MKRSKLYRSRSAGLEPGATYPLEQVVEMLKAMPPAKFDETVEISYRLGVDPRQSDQAVRGAMVLPHGTGKPVRVVVVAEGEAAEQARAAGADEVGSDELIDRIKGGWLDFDVMIATPAAMKGVRALGRVLGPRGLMPNPKTGTVRDDTAGAVTEAKAGRVEYRCDRGGCIHVPIGKISFEPERLLGNANAVTEAILRARPASAKGTYLQKMTISCTMSPGLRVDVRTVVKGEGK
ncbi:MAG: 50S ribosomal protein L1 [Lentisphaeria bacterium]|nr:50S ribosomal protein L1 [Lentisphaeria bacterium]